MSFSDHNAIQLDINIKTKGKKITWSPDFRSPEKFYCSFLKETRVNKKMQIKMLNI